MLNAARTVIRRISKNGVRFSSYDSSSKEKAFAHMNQLPVPKGSWQKNYDAKQKTYNMQLVAGLSILGGTITYIVQSDSFFFNAFPPKIPEGEKW
ncbi:uncharacterized protein LOC122506023 [Leptopilina heterotoma]|uniref:uncharacterized protein LOC122506023 n=1 Tax=Leptopilina heterotoma TaxID=63436 RepID=UPI001CA9A74A|nr:uncharacterized protein LOC122506023 [Leptopilina heterotoma]